MSQTVIKWHLAELMARHRIKGKDLAEFLGVNNNAVSNLKASGTMPRLDGDRLNQLLNGLNKLAAPDTLEGGISLLDLMNYAPDVESAEQN